MESFLQTSSPQKAKFNIKSHKILRLNTVQKEADIVQQSKLLKNRSFGRIRINSMKVVQSIGLKQKIRKYTQTEQQLSPLLNPLKLSPFKQYESKLKLSAQSWIIYDMKIDSYKRGWKPNKISQFNGMLRILVLLCYCQLIKKNQNFKKLKIKIDPHQLKEAKNKLCKKQEKRLKWIAQSKRTFKTLSKGTIISLIDIIKGMIVTGNQDLLEYGLIYCGYILYHIQKTKSCEDYQPFVSLNSEKQQQIYADTFCSYLNQTFFKLSLILADTKLRNTDQFYELNSTPNQICKIFLYGYQNHYFFKETIILQRLVCPIRFQVGFNYWQDRMITFKAKKQEMRNDHFCYLVYKGSKSYEAICYNSFLNILMIIEDSKFSMADLDIEILQKWFINVTKPIITKNKSSSISPDKKQKCLLPILEMTKN